MSKDIHLYSDEFVMSRIHVIRGHKVMLDRDLAQLFEVETKVLNQAVRRNATRFPEDFMFQLTSEEAEASRSQNVTLKQVEQRHEETELLEEIRRKKAKKTIGFKAVKK